MAVIPGQAAPCSFCGAAPDAATATMLFVGGPGLHRVCSDCVRRLRATGTPVGEPVVCNWCQAVEREVHQGQSGCICSGCLMLANEMLEMEAGRG